MQPPIGLDLANCRIRLGRLRQALAGRHLDAALLTDRRHVHYFTGYWHFSTHNAVALWVPAGGESILIAPHPVAGACAADRVLPYESNKFCTMVDDHYAGIFDVLQSRLNDSRRVGADDPRRPWLASGVAWSNLLPDLFAFRRTKDDDELRLIRRSIACAEAAYRRAREILKPGVTETRLYAEMQASAFEEAGEYIGDFGNDFQCGSGGGPPRPRPAEAGEIAVLDVTVIYRGYCCDLCRSMAVDRQPSPAQREAHRLLADALAYVESHVQPGIRCRALFEEVSAKLDGVNGWRFAHHLGHGIGLAPHETPRLNPNWEDVFQPGDVFSAEPGLYAPELRGGLRLEQDYRVISGGVQRLSAFSTDL